MGRILIARMICFFAIMTITLPAFAQQRRVANSDDELQRERLLSQVTERARPDSRRLITDRQIEAQQTEIPPSQKAQMAQTQLASATNDDEKSAAKKSLSEALEECFDLDIKNREAQLEAIRQRLAEMEAQVKKRIEGKDEIVQLRLQVLMNNASGLGWTDAPGNAFGNQNGDWLSPQRNHPNDFRVQRSQDLRREAFESPRQ